MIAMTQVGPGTSLWLVRLIMVALGLGISAAAVALIAVLVARTVNDTDAAATMVRPQRSAVSSPQQPREAPVG
jgi:hypothetical protein